MTDEPLTPELLLSAYSKGYFPMAQSREDSTLQWFYPEKRGIIPLENFHISRSLAKLMSKSPFTLTMNEAFPDVIKACAQPRPKHSETWINATIIELYTELWGMGYGYSMECWQDDKLVGGVYGLSIGRAFFAESMFSHVTGASKVALASLLTMLSDAGYMLFDTQYMNEHLVQFGAIEIPRKDYLERLKNALQPKIE